MPTIGENVNFSSATLAGRASKYLKLDEEIMKLREHPELATPITCEDEADKKRTVAHVRKMNKGQEIKVHTANDKEDPLVLWIGVNL